jgi:hypothetical protein
MSDLNPYTIRYTKLLREYRRRMKLKKAKANRPSLSKRKSRGPKPRRQGPDVTFTAKGPILTMITDTDHPTTFSSLDAASIGAYDTYRLKNGTVTPGFRTLKKTGLPVNAYNQETRRSSASGYTGTILTYNAYGELSNTRVTTISDARAVDTFWPRFFGDVTSTESEFKARSRLAEQVNKSSVNLGVMFAERKQTSSLIASTAVRLAGAALSLKRGDLKGVYSFLSVGSKTPSQKELDRVLRTRPDKRVASHWLEYNFGWVPLLNDVYGSCELLAHHAAGKVYHTSARASARHTHSRVFSIKAGNNFNGNLISSSKTNYVAHYRLDSYAKAALAQTGLSNPLTVAWEILPYSFVVDWFIPVSNYLQTLMAFDGFELVQGSKSTVWTGVITKNFARTYVSGNPSHPDQILIETGESSWTQSIFSRSRLASFPDSVPPSFRNPLERGPLWKLATSAALIRQVFGKTFI